MQENICCTLLSSMGSGGGNIPLVKEEKEMNKYRLRKLTSKECFRLMGFSDNDYQKAKEVPTSNAQLYKQAGNSIVVNVLEGIFTSLQTAYPEEFKNKNC